MSERPASDAREGSTGSEEADLAAVRRVLAGDTAAFATIVERWQSPLLNLAWRFCRERSLAEDMPQEAFVKAFRALDTFRGDARFSTWLIALSLNSYRSTLRARPLPDINLDLVRLVATEPTPLVALQDRERDEIVRQLVTTLPPRYRGPIVLFYFQERSVAEAARVLDIPEGTLKARLSRGRAVLARRYAARMSHSTGRE